MGEGENGKGREEGRERGEGGEGGKGKRGGQEMIADKLQSTDWLVRHCQHQLM